MIRGKTRTEGDFWRRIVSGNYVRSVHMSGAIGPAKSAEYPELRVQEDAKWVGEEWNYWNKHEANFTVHQIRICLLMLPEIRPCKLVNVESVGGPRLMGVMAMSPLGVFFLARR
ncbi:hypothetical protein HC256_008719 [Beauveria bassiana]|nr:hypothetical protein HC256_008719 [Beauveria bassiana]